MPCAANPVNVKSYHQAVLVLCKTAAERLNVTANPNDECSYEPALCDLVATYGLERVKAAVGVHLQKTFADWCLAHQKWDGFRGRAVVGTPAFETAAAENQVWFDSELKAGNLASFAKTEYTPQADQAIVDAVAT